jgi:DNA replication initiation complex subunit (GINS family)
MITYNDIYEANRKEKYSDKLEFLPKNFLQEVASYIKEKKEIAGKDDDLFSDVILKTKKQLENALLLFKELMRQRRKKLLQLAFVASETGISKRDYDHMLDVEKKLFESIMKSVEQAEREIQSEMRMQNKNNTSMLLILCTSPIESFLGLDGEKLGPYAQGQIVNLPKQIAEILIADNKAEIVEE